MRYSFSSVFESLLKEKKKMKECLNSNWLEKN